MTTISILTPCYNEEDNVEELYTLYTVRLVQNAFRRI